MFYTLCDVVSEWMIYSSFKLGRQIYIFDIWHDESKLDNYGITTQYFNHYVKSFLLSFIVPSCIIVQFIFLYCSVSFHYFTAWLNEYNCLARYLHRRQTIIVIKSILQTTNWQCAEHCAVYLKLLACCHAKQNCKNIFCLCRIRYI